MEETDGDLARRAAAGDAAAFGVLYDRYLARVYRYALLRLADPTEAEAVTSDVFFQALGALHRYEPRTAFLAWLFRIARNAIIDRTRRRQRRPSTSLDEASVRLRRTGERDDPEAASIARDEARRLRASLEALSPLQREVVLLRFFDDLSTEEICSVIGKGPSTVRGIQHRALAALRQLIPERELV